MEKSFFSIIILRMIFSDYDTHFHFCREMIRFSVCIWDYAHFLLCLDRRISYFSGATWNFGLVFHIYAYFSPGAVIYYGKRKARIKWRKKRRFPGISTVYALAGNFWYENYFLGNFGEVNCVSRKNAVISQNRAPILPETSHYKIFEKKSLK